MSAYFDNRLFHVAYVGTDLDAMVDRMLQSGIGPWYYARELHLASRYRGERQDLVISVAFAYTGDQMIELVVQDNDVPSSYKEHLALHPDGGLHHVAYMSDDLEQSIADLKAKGLDFVKVQEFLGSNGLPTEIYMETRGAKDPVFMQIVLPSPWDDAFAQLKEECAKWDGSEPRRDMGDLLAPEIKAALATGHPV
jgi:catechol 2,3-dioxygenase-like lactoylglutathione lyase family enzyme